jgi:GTP-binding protein
MQLQTSKEFRVVSAEFMAAAATHEQLPPPTLPEIAFAGRSNVGKSSLMNALMQRRNLVRTSNTPGCTRTINIFEAKTAEGAAYHLVDLPGYGYARRSKQERGHWAHLIDDYLQERVSLRAVVVLVDVRRGVEEEEQEFLEFIQSIDNAQRPKLQVILVATKIDKIPLSQRKPAIQLAGGTHKWRVLGFSAESGEGSEQLWRRVRSAAGIVSLEQPASEVVNAVPEPLVEVVGESLNGTSGTAVSTNEPPKKVRKPRKNRGKKA